jgi:hypothetical protein
VNDLGHIVDLDRVRELHVLADAIRQNGRENNVMDHIVGVPYGGYKVSNLPN